MTNAPILLVGNGPNRVSPQGVSWSQLMGELRATAGMATSGHETKPFPLHFEEIRNAFLARTPKAKEATFLRLVAKRMEALRPNDIHRRLTALNVANILTTNYDDCLERALAPTASVADFDTGESKHSLFRRSRIGRRYFWHLHGEIWRPNSVLLGHDRYVESCSHLRHYLDPRQGIAFKQHPQGLKALFLDANAAISVRRPHSWVDLFMLRDVHIVGLSMDYTEIDLWYLLSLRHRLRLHPAAARDRLRKTRVVFHTFDQDTPALRQHRQLLESFGATCRVHPLRAQDYAGAWDGLLATLERELGRA